MDIGGPWQVQFDPAWFYPTGPLPADAEKGRVVFDRLDDWSTRPEEPVRYYSGTAVYRRHFTWKGTRTGNIRSFSTWAA